MAWAEEQAEQDPDYFSRLLDGQAPISCGSAVRTAAWRPIASPADRFTRSPPGGLFIHRDIANLVSEDDLNLMSVVQFAIEILKVRHVIVCGGSGSCTAGYTICATGVSSR